MICPRCHGLFIETDNYGEDIIVLGLRCVNCGYYSFGLERKRYDPLRPVEKLGRWAQRLKY